MQHIHYSCLFFRQYYGSVTFMQHMVHTPLVGSRCVILVVYRASVVFVVNTQYS